MSMGPLTHQLDVNEHQYGVNERQKSAGSLVMPPGSCKIFWLSEPLHA